MLKPSLFIFFLACSFELLGQQNASDALMEQMQREREAQMGAVSDAQVLYQETTDVSPSSTATTGKMLKFNIDEMLAPYRQLPPEQTKEHLRMKLQGKPIIDNPKMVNFLDALIRDEKALKDVAQIIENKKKLFSFVVFNILVFFIGFMFRKLHKAKDEKSSFLGRFARRLWRVGCMTGIRLSIIIYFFGQNLARTWDIARNHLI